VFKYNPFPLSQGPVRSNISGAALSSHLICDIVVSNAQAGAVIGRQGTHIKTIMSKSHALVAVSYLCNQQTGVMSQRWGCYRDDVVAVPVVRHWSVRPTLTAAHLLITAASTDA